MIVAVEVREQCRKCFHFQVCASVLKNDLYIRGVLLGEKEPKCQAFVEVVRCKGCKHWRPSGSMAGNSEDDLQPIGGCDWAICCRKANDFCSYGERREGE